MTQSEEMIEKMMKRGASREHAEIMARDLLSPETRRWARQAAHDILSEATPEEISKVAKNND